MRNNPYTKQSLIDSTEVPDWKRREEKWSDLVEDVLQLEPGQTLPVLFDDPKAANRARNAVRDRANRLLNKAVIRTRLVKREDGKVELFLIRTRQKVTIED